MHEILLSHYQALLPRQGGAGLCLGTAHSFGTEIIRVIRGAGWKELTVTATFHPALGTPVRMLVPEDGILSVPQEATAAPTTEETPGVIVFTGTAAGKQRISADLRYTVLAHAPEDGTSPAAPTESEWSQLLQAYASKVDKQQSPADAGKVLGIDESGQVIPVEQTGGSGGTVIAGGAPADWSVNDPNTPGYVQNRTHWMDDPVEVTVLSEQTAVITEEMMAFFFSETGMEIGTEYTMTIDGTAFLCTAYEMEDMVVIGNGALIGFGNDTGEPFFAGYSAEESALVLVLPAPGEHTVSLSGVFTQYHPLDSKFLPPTVGSFGEGNGAEVFNTVMNIAAGSYSHAEGRQTAAYGDGSHAEGSSTVAQNDCAHAEGYNTLAFGLYSHAEGKETVSNAFGSHSEGIGTKAMCDAQHVEGKWNQVDTQGKYAHILGGGQAEGLRANLHTVDWNGNAWFAGNLHPFGGLILTSPGAVKYLLTVTNDGTLKLERV